MWIQISSGQGPDECELAVSLFLKAYQTECKTKGINAKVINSIPGKLPNNLKSVLLALDSSQYSERISGTILWVCPSPYRPNHKRKNWFINIDFFTAAEQQLNLCEKDIIFEALRSSGPGGQNVNKVETAVRAVHSPTGITVTAQEERSQYLNKKLALARIANLIIAKNAENSSNHKKSMWQQHNMLTRGNPVRIYQGKTFKLLPTQA
ncbi:MAG: putative peptide chain release factor [Firmicutes bacterium]|nr:putative peptide chain release factor [Bacillota bacterium]